MWGGGLGLAQPVLGDVGDGVEVEGGGGVAAVMAVVAGGVAVAGVADRAGRDLRAGGGFWILDFAGVWELLLYAKKIKK